MRTSLQRLPAALALAALLVAVGASTAAARHVSGRAIGVNMTTEKISGDLVGTWKLTHFKIRAHNPVFYATGTERFTGCLDRNRDRSCTGDPTGTLSFTFRYWARMKGNDVLLGTCSHPVTGGTGGLAGAKGFVMMVDTPKRSGHGTNTQYEGDIRLPGEDAPASAARVC
jgi:hypothetical protein